MKAPITGVVWGVGVRREYLAVVGVDVGGRDDLRLKGLIRTVGMVLCVFGAATDASVSMASPPPAQALSIGDRRPVFRSLANPAAPWTDDGRQTLLTFVHITDTHVGKVPQTPQGPVDDAEAFKEVIEAINGLSPRPAFTLITGDLTDGWRPDEIRRFKALREELMTPCYVVGGNHDVTFDPTPSHLKDWERTFPDAPLPYAFKRGPFAFIGFDSQVYNAKRTDRAVDPMAAQQWTELVGLVRAARKEGKRIFLFAHIPAIPSFFRQKVKASWETPYVEPYLRLLKDERVEATLTGHLHRDEMYIREETLFLNAPPVSRWETRDSSYRLYRVTDQGLMYRQIYTGPEGRQRSYEVDLHGVTEKGYGAWVDGLDESGLRVLWEQRYAGDDASGRLFGDLNREHFRAFLKDPFSYQPTRGAVRRFKPRGSGSGGR